jgi:hypothetical protein
MIPLDGRCGVLEVKPRKQIGLMNSSGTFSCEDDIWVEAWEPLVVAARQWLRVVRKDSISDTTWVPVQMNVLHRSVNLCWTSDDTLSSGLVRIQAMVQPGDSLWIGADWKAIKRESWKQQKPKMIAVASPSQDGLTYPFCAYGSATLPTEHPVLFKNATVWTCDKAGKLDSTDVLIRGGKIERIGNNIDAAKYADVEVIDATGKHITPGIIDEHSHIDLSVSIKNNNRVFPNIDGIKFLNHQGGCGGTRQDGAHGPARGVRTGGCQGVYG